MGVFGGLWYVFWFFLEGWGGLGEMMRADGGVGEVMEKLWKGEAYVWKSG